MEVLLEEDPDTETKTASNTTTDNNAGGAWEALEEEISDVNLLIQKSSEKESVQVIKIHNDISYKIYCYLAGNTEE